MKAAHSPSGTTPIACNRGGNGDQWKMSKNTGPQFIRFTQKNTNKTTKTREKIRSKNTCVFVMGPKKNKGDGGDVRVKILWGKKLSCCDLRTTRLILHGKEMRVGIALDNLRLAKKIREHTILFRTPTQGQTAQNSQIRMMTPTFTQIFYLEPDFTMGHRRDLGKNISGVNPGKLARTQPMKARNMICTEKTLPFPKTKIELMWLLAPKTEGRQ